LFGEQSAENYSNYDTLSCLRRTTLLNRKAGQGLLRLAWISGAVGGRFQNRVWFERVVILSLRIVFLVTIALQLRYILWISMLLIRMILSAMTHLTKIATERPC